MMMVTARAGHAAAQQSRGDAGQSLNLVDLFCGAGGFSLGAHQAGLDVAAAFDKDPVLSLSFGHNFPNTELVHTDVSTLTGAKVRGIVEGKIDGVFGGPPCQGFSDIGKRLPGDPRRELLGHFFRVVQEIEPAFFVMENVRGLAYSDARGVLEKALEQIEDRYHLFGPHILDASTFGAATKRSRLFVIGIHQDHGDALTLDDLEAFRRPPVTVRAAISDLEGARFLGEADGFDRWRITRPGRPYAYARRLRSSDGSFTGQRPTEHSARVAERFASLPAGSIDPIGRHPKLDWDAQCPTLRAGTGSDRGSFQSVRPVHPGAPRVITVREAARLQGFPDCHRFHPTIWHSFRMIGNSVSPVIAKVIFEAIALKLDRVSKHALAAE